MKKLTRVLLCGLMFPGFVTFAAPYSGNETALRGKPSANHGKCCQTLGEVRSNIDRIDNQIIQLKAERQQYVLEAGRFKPDSAAVADPTRVNTVVERAMLLATHYGLDPEVAAHTFRTMSESFTQYEAKKVAEANKQ